MAVTFYLPDDLKKYCPNSKNSTKSKNYRSVTSHRDINILNKILANRILKYIKEILHHKQVGLIPGM